MDCPRNLKHLKLSNRKREKKTRRVRIDEADGLDAGSGLLGTASDLMLREVSGATYGPISRFESEPCGDLIFLGLKLRLGPQLREALLRHGGTSSPPKANGNAKRSFEKVRAQAELGYENTFKRTAALHALAERFQFLLRLC